MIEVTLKQWAFMLWIFIPLIFSYAVGVIVGIGFMQDREDAE